MKKLALFFDKEYLPPGMPHTIMLYPFWGKNAEDPADPTSGRFDRYEAHGQEYLEYADLRDCEFSVLPFAWEHAGSEPAIRAAERLVDASRRAGKEVIVFYVHDSAEPVPLDGSIVFRTSLYASRRQPNEYAMPAWSEDIVDRYLGGQIPVRPKSDVPVVGFCGYSDPLAASLRPRLRKMLGRQIWPSGLEIRRQALRHLSKSPSVRTNFILRDRFIGGYAAEGLAEGKRRVRDEFVENILASDYILCVRGAGNFSYRLYETLCCGRVSIFVDTDCVIPFESNIDWKNYCVWIDDKDLGSIAEKVAEFHDRLSEDDWVKLQNRCRTLWTEMLSPQGFFSNINLCLRERIEFAS